MADSRPQPSNGDGPALRIDLDRLRRDRSLMIATPAYGGQTLAPYNLSVWSLETLLMQCGIAHNHIVTFNDPYISYARNRLTQLFLESPYTDLLFIDADVEFNPADVIALLHFDKDVIGGTYPRKEIDWEAVKRVALENPDIPPQDLATAAGVFTTGMVCETITPFVPTLTWELATGFMLIKRKVFETLAPHCQRYKAQPLDRPKFSRDETVVKSQWITDFFPSGVIGDEWVGDDFQFCRKWLAIGGEIYVCPWMQVAHHGTHRFPGNMHMAWQYKYRKEIEAAEIAKRPVEQNVAGWMSDRELVWLAEQARQHQYIVEIGSWMGRSTRVLAENTPGGVIAVDTWQGSEEHQELLKDKPPDWLYEEFMRNVKRLPVAPMRMTSLEAAKKLRDKKYKFDMIFIDGSHDYESVKQDIEAWLPLLAEGGLLCGHDIYEDGVNRAIKELFPDSLTVEWPTTIWSAKVYAPAEKE